MLSATLIGAVIGAAFACLMWALAASGLEKLNQGLLTSTGFVLLIAACLWWDGYILVAILGYVLAAAGIVRAETALR